MSIRIAAAVASSALAIGLGTIVTQTPAYSAEAAVHAPAPAVDPAVKAPTATAVFAGGCFWGVQGVYQRVKGVTAAVSGYTGGAAATARYDLIATGDTGHAEAVRITYDPRVVSYGKLLQIFFSVVADPTTLNHQGPDHGPQYRTAIFPQNEAQRKVAAAYIGQLGAAKLWQAPIVTRLERARAFYPAERYHQDYLVRNPRARYIVVNDAPKIAAFKAMFPHLWRDRPVLVRG